MNYHGIFTGLSSEINQIILCSLRVFVCWVAVSIRMHCSSPSYPLLGRSPVGYTLLVIVLFKYIFLSGYSIKDKERLKIYIDWRDEYQGCVMRQDGLKVNELLLLSKL